jgi:hypothetical protein
MAREDYPLYVHWSTSLDNILQRAECFPRNARFTLASRMVDTGLDVMESIVGAIYTSDRIPLLEQINGKLEWLRVLVGIAYRRRYMSTKQYETMARDIDTTGRMVGGWIKRIKAAACTAADA